MVTDLEVVVAKLVGVLLEQGGVGGGKLDVGRGAHTTVGLQQLLLRLVQLRLGHGEQTLAI